MKNNDWLLNAFLSIMYSSTRKKPTDEELDYLYTYLDVKVDSTNKIIYYDAIYHFKRWYPKFIIFFLAKYRIKNHLKKTKAPQSLYLLYAEFAKYTVNSAFKAYCRCSD